MPEIGHMKNAQKKKYKKESKSVEVLVPNYIT